jgi:hypothetical protein
MLASQKCIGGAAVTDFGIATIERGPPATRNPEVLVGRGDHPSVGQFDIGLSAVDNVAAVDPVTQDTEAELTTVS